MTVTDKWQRIVAPTADKLGLPGKMGVPLTLTPDAGKAASELLMQLARLADVQEARHFVIVRSFWLLVLAFVVLAVAL